MTSSEVCARFRITEGTLRTWRDQGRIRAYQLGPRVWRYSALEIEEFIASAATDREVIA